LNPRAPATVVLAAVALGCYSPNPTSGNLRCGTNQSCPEGYTCADGRTCWKKGEAPTCVATGASITKFVNHWNFSPTSTIVISCSDGSSSTQSLMGDFLDVNPGLVGDLTASYYCDWDMRVPAGNSAVICPGQSCDSVDSASGTMFTWHGDAFTFTTADGVTATLTAMISANFVDPPTAPVPNQTGTCNLRINGTLTPGP
jgi:hypothetical protein